MLLQHLKQYLEGVEEKATLLAKKFPDKSQADLKLLAEKIDNKLIDINIQSIKSDAIDKLIQLAKNTKSKTAAKTKGVEGLVENEDYFITPTKTKDATAYVVLNHKASKTIASKRVCGAEGKWCIAENNPYQWDANVRRDGKNTMVIYVVLPQDKIAIMTHYDYRREEGDNFSFTAYDKNDKTMDGKTYVRKFGIDIKSTYEKFLSLVRY
jgi:hypothetical protein